MKRQDFEAALAGVAITALVIALTLAFEAHAQTPAPTPAPSPMMLVAVLGVFPTGKYKTTTDFKKAWLEVDRLCQRLPVTDCDIRTMPVYCYEQGGDVTAKCTRYSLYGRMPEQIDGVARATWLSRHGFFR